MKKITEQSKKIILLTTISSVLLILSTAILFVVKSKNNPTQSSPWLLIAIVILGIISAVIAITLRVKRNKHSNYLRNEYYESYETIRDALQNSTMSLLERKDVLMDIADILYLAQESNRPIEQVVSQDVDNFIKGISNSFGYRNSVVFNFVSGIQNLIFTFTIIQIAIYFSRGTHSFFDTTIGFMIIPYTILMAFLLLPLMKYFTAKQKTLWSFISPIILVAAFITFNELLHAYGMHLQWVKTYFDSEVPFISSVNMLAFIMTVLILSLITKWFLRNRSIRKM